MLLLNLGAPATSANSRGSTVLHLLCGKGDDYIFFTYKGTVYLTCTCCLYDRKPQTDSTIVLRTNRGDAAEFGRRSEQQGC